MKKILAVTATVMVGAASLYAVLHGLPLGQLGETYAALFARVRWPLFGLALASFLLLWLLHGVRYAVVISPWRALPTGQLIGLTGVGLMLNWLVPARAGDLYRAVRLANRTGLPLSRTLAASSVDLVLWGGSFFLWLVPVFAATSGAFSRVPALRPLVLGGGSVLLGLGGACVFASWRWVRRGEPPQHRWALRLWDFANTLLALLTPRTAALAIGLAVVGWGAEIGIVYFLARAFGLAASWTDGWLTVAALCAAMVLPAPGAVGVFELAASRMFALMGAAPLEALALAVAYHLMFFGLSIGLGVVCALLPMFSRRPVRAVV